MGEPLDLYDIALLLNYERASTEPRFRHAKLREAVRNENFKTIKVIGSQEWLTSAAVEKMGFVFDTKPGKNSEERDTPANILPSPIPPSLQALTAKELETIFWQVRNHDACYTSVNLAQHFFELYPDHTKLRVRTWKGVEYITTVSTRVILELKIIDPITMTHATVLPRGTTYITGDESYEMNHAVLGFASSREGNIDTILDMSSLQFGDAGRGLGGKSLFALESLDEFYDRVETIARGADTENARTSMAITPAAAHIEAWLAGVAKRVKERWDKRHQEHWCGHCGGPAATQRCSKCGGAYYCDRRHQVAAWPFHKRFCKKA
ncbi:hypothetical protein BDZ89DRAFT_1073159 [Hymenopellis radicata]|nr:hypothetical protein BDZ89DRAFT_1073159 [Hymenopellis radicata]